MTLRPRVVAGLLGLVLVGLPTEAATAPGPVTVRLVWERRGFPAEMHVHEVARERRVDLWETRSVKDLGEAPVGAPIQEGRLRLRPGEVRRVALVVRNTGTSPLYFFAAPHDVQPPEHTLGFKVKCLCINHAFAVPPGESWYRIVEIRLSRHLVAEALDIRHVLIGISAERMKPFTLPAAGHAASDDLSLAAIVRWIRR